MSPSCSARWWVRQRCSVGFFWLTAIVVILAWLFLRWVVRGRFGDVLIAIRDDEPRLRFAGYNPTLFKTIVFAIAGGFGRDWWCALHRAVRHRFAAVHDCSLLD